MSSAAIITADIVNSSKLKLAEEKKLIKEINLTLSPYKYEFYRGDSFQAYIQEPDKALIVILKIRSAAKIINPIYDVRSSIGIGNIKVKPGKLHTSTGEAFTLSGRAFDELSKDDNRLRMQSSDSFLNSALNVVSYFVDYIFKDLTSKQAEVLFALFTNKTQSEAAKKLHKSQSTISKHVQSAGWHELTKVMREYENLVA